MSSGSVTGFRRLPAALPGDIEPAMAGRADGGREADCIMISGAVCINVFAPFASIWIFALIALFVIFAVYLVCTVYPMPRHFPNGYQHSSHLSLRLSGLLR
jgi:hypothetical protein